MDDLFCSFFTYVTSARTSEEGFIAILSRTLITFAVEAVTQQQHNRHTSIKQLLLSIASDDIIKANDTRVLWIEFRDVAWTAKLCVHRPNPALF